MTNPTPSDTPLDDMDISYQVADLFNVEKTYPYRSRDRFKLYESIVSLCQRYAEQKLAARTTALLDEVASEVIDATKEIYTMNDLPNLLATDEYVKIREELRAEQRQKLAALRAKYETITAADKSGKG